MLKIIAKEDDYIPCEFHELPLKIKNLNE